MTFDEFALFSSALKTFYPKENLLPTKEAASLWYQQLMDLDALTLNVALQKWVNTEKWPPTIAELRSMCVEITDGKLQEWGAAWAEVQYAIRRYGFMRPEEAKESMSPITRQTVDRLGWLDICCSENPEALRAQFRQIYEICSSRAVEDRQIPLALREKIADIGLMAKQGETKLLGGESK